MVAPQRRIKPGWILLAVVLVYAVAVSVAWRSALAAARAVQPPLGAALDVPPLAAAALLPAAPVASAPVAPAPEPSPSASSAAAPPASTSLWWPVPGGTIPTDPAYLPGAAQDARGTREGFLIWPDTAGVPFGYGSAVIAVGDGIVVRADASYRELDVLTWERLNRSLEPSLLSEARDRLLGRQLWLELDDGRVVRYGHLSAIRDGIVIGRRVERGRVIAFAGNSGTLDAAAGRTSGARLHVELRDGGSFMGEGLSAEAVREWARTTFVGP